MEPSNGEGWDVAGLGKVAKAIPPRVWTQTATTVLGTFEKVVAPLTATTDGLGRYIRQKFEGMVEQEKALAAYCLQEAIARAKARSEKAGRTLGPASAKTFVRTLEEASKEVEPLLHEMWVNLLASQLATDDCHPHFVQTLSHFSTQEAQLLLRLKRPDEIGTHGGGFLSWSMGSFNWFYVHGDAQRESWSISCTLLTEFGFAEVLAPKEKGEKHSAILVLSPLGHKFLQAAGALTDAQVPDPSES